MINPIFTIGVPRSGTTLLRVMLDSHPEIAAGPECPWISGSYSKTTSFSDLYYSLVNDMRGPVRNFKGVSEDVIASALGSAISDIMRKYAEASGKKQWIEKTPNHITEIPYIIRLFPESKFIHIVRDGRDVACSSFRERATWGASLENRGQMMINTRLNALQRWCRWISDFEKWQFQYSLDVCRISYEDMVEEPGSVMQKVLSFIGMPWSDDVLKYKNHKHDMPDWEAGSRDVSQKPEVTAKSVERWMNEFTSLERLIASSFADHMLLRLGYAPTLPEKRLLLRGLRATVD
ncbi:MAG TPA: sulfotransferase [Nitrospirae bacterium]|nr:sulfotransferase [Nitrospirota bacterium]